MNLKEIPGLNHENLIGFLGVNPREHEGFPKSGNSGVFNCQGSLHSASSNLSKLPFHCSHQLCLSRFCSWKADIYCDSICLSLQFLECWFVLWLQFSGIAKKSYWFSAFSAFFLLWGQSGDFLQVGVETSSHLYIFLKVLSPFSL